ncbi:gluconate:H+ symporter, GntP family [Proteiniborus ethanoligenes]|uniref:Gluconate:H+ symporter, GntP family n=1 Tax=Proteiniborus ethanoligenes TaxID=415015 RepID=A0A1H3PV62_9FIRM|nr:gluconate:H+ symporter [Proteiniborus ethanoligenes]SDZ04831.1 gluconate:H+ symporter, GntP family [Proteiniborus ethanoligenes]
MPVLLSLAITIVLIIFLIIKLKTNPAVALFIGSLFMGISSKLGLVTTVSTITTGFGNTMAALGFSVGFGVMLGELVAATGAVQSIANNIVKFFSKDKSEYALGLTGFIVSIPVFYDVGYVVLMPLARALSKKGNKIIPYFAGALVAGLGIAHTFIPPTPGPLTGASLLGVDVGAMILWGIVIGFPTFILAMFVYDKFFLSRKNFWDPTKDEEYDEAHAAEQRKLESELIKDEKELPGFFLSLLPVFVPIILIILGTVSSVTMGAENVPEIIKFVSDKHVAMFFGLLSAILLALSRNMKLGEIEKVLNTSLSSIGTVLFITGSGASLGAVLGAVKVGDALLEVVGAINIHPILFVWLIAALLKLAQGSGTVAMITTVSMVAPMAAQLDVAPVFLALAAFSGTLATAHVNDSAFWITSKMAGLTVTGGFKVYTLVCALQAVISLILIFAASFIF